MRGQFFKMASESAIALYQKRLALESSLYTVTDFLRYPFQENAHSASLLSH